MAVMQLNSEWFLRHPGAIVQVRTDSVYGALIRELIDCEFNHDAICCVRNGRAGIGDAEPLLAKLHTINEYNQNLINGKITKVRVMLPHDYNYLNGVEAGFWWMNNVEYKLYDFLAIYQILKRILERRLRLPKIGTEWSWFCTEGVCRSWGCRYWKKDCSEATPRTTHNRLVEGVFVDYTREATYMI